MSIGTLLQRYSSISKLTKRITEPCIPLTDESHTVFIIHLPNSELSATYA